MLKKLSVKNFAIIEDLTVSFKDKMTVLTGQTGAGKSLIIDSISLLMGSRADSDMIRYGCEKAFILGEFITNNPKLNNLLEDNNINVLDTLTIYREISINGRNTIKVNGVNVSLLLLSKISFYIADIHVQHDTFRLINPDTYLSFIDDLDDDVLNEYINKYTISFLNYQNDLKKYKDLLNKRDSSKERLDYILFQKKEIEELELTTDIDIRLEEEIEKLSNFDKIYKSLNESYELLDNDYFSVDNIYNAYKTLDKISSFDKEYKENTEKLSDMYYMLTDIKSSIYKSINNLDFDEELLNQLNERLNSIEKIKSKYKMTVNELIDYLDKISLEIDLANNYDEVVKNYLNNLEKSYIKLKDISIKITDYRKKEAKKIEKAIINECHDLELNDIDFKIVFKDISYDNCLNSNIFKEYGVDEVDFMITLNKGEPLKPLHKVASGGELSRIMLAFKSYFSLKSKLSLMIFDEIDSGVSGDAALKIALKMKKISTYVQVLCITHLPRVASIADNHIWIYKEEKDNRTITNIKELDFEERKYHIAQMIGGNRISKYSLDAASALLNNE